MKKWLFLILLTLGIAEVKNVSASTKDFEVGTLDNRNRTPGLICPRACNSNHGTWTGSAKINPNPKGQSTCNCKVEGALASATNSSTSSSVTPSVNSPKPAGPTSSAHLPRQPVAPQKPLASGPGEKNTQATPKPSVSTASASTASVNSSLKNFSSGPIWNGNHAKSVCPKKCSDNKGEWKGVWWTPQETWGRDSICQCVVGADASKPEAPKPTTPETPKPDASKPEAPKPTTPETPKPDASKPEAPKPTTPETPKPDASKPEAPKPTTPETPKPDASKPEAPKPTTPEAPKPDASTTAKDVEAGPIFNQAGAQQRCPVVCNGKDKWTGHWKTTVPGKMSVCNCLPGADASKPEAPKTTTPEAPKPDASMTSSSQKPNASPKDKGSVHKLNFDEGVDAVIESAVVDESTKIDFKKEESSALDRPDRAALEIFADIWSLVVNWIS